MNNPDYFILQMSQQQQQLQPLTPTQTTQTQPTLPTVTVTATGVGPTATAGGIGSTTNSQSTNVPLLQSNQSSNGPQNAQWKMELIPILESPRIDIWPLLMGLKYYCDDLSVQGLISCKLRKMKVRRLEFFLPQLCQIVIDKGLKNKIYKSMPLKRFLIDQCRISIRSFLLIFFYFQAAYEDNTSPELSEMALQILQEAVFTAVNSNRDEGVHRLFPMYKALMQKKHTTLNKSLSTSFPNLAVRTYTRITDLSSEGDNPTNDGSSANLNVAQNVISQFPQSSIVTINDKIEEILKGVVPGLEYMEIPESTKSPLREKEIFRDFDTIGDNIAKITQSLNHLTKLKKKYHKIYKKEEERHKEEDPLDAKMQLQIAVAKDGKSFFENTVESDDEELTGEAVQQILKATEKLYICQTPVKPRELETPHQIEENYLLRKSYYYNQLRFIRGLTSISTMLVDLKLSSKELKNYALRMALKKLNKYRGFLDGVYIPIFSPTGCPYRVVRIPYGEAMCLNSRDRVPYMLNLEVISGEVEQKGTNNDSTMNKSREAKQTYSTPKKGKREKKGEKDEWVVVHSADYEYLEKAFGPNWEKRKENLRAFSPYGHVPGWDVISVIVKSGDDLRQEQLAMQLIQVFYEVFNEEALPLWLNPYMVLATSRNAGLLETVHDAISIHGLKQRLNLDSLATYFTKAYGNPESHTYKTAQKNFIESLAAYSLVCYLLQIKDRHNGNIMIDREGHIIHIDYGFMLSSSPGNMKFETAPFKLPLEFVAVMGGDQSDMFTYFKTLINSGYIAIRKHYQKFLTLVELMMQAGSGKMACFQLGEITISNLKSRFELSLPEEGIVAFTDKLVTDSAGHWTTGAYDGFQYYSNGIL